MYASTPDEAADTGGSGARRAAARDSPTFAPLAVDRFAFPPRWRTVSLPVSPSDVACRGMTLYAASRTAPLIAQQGLYALSRLFGTRVVPGARSTWEPPTGREAFERLWAEWTSLMGGRIDGFAAYERAQPTRTGLALLLCSGDRSVFVRVQDDGDGLELDRRLSAAAVTARPASFRVPAVEGGGEIDGWHWLAYEPLSSRPHVPLRPSTGVLADITSDVTHLVESVLERTADVPDHWRGAHGDLTPWNLRRAGRTTWLIDWEDMTWAPPGTDEVYFRSVRAAFSRRPRPLRLSGAHAEARRHLYGIVEARRAVAVEGSLRSQMLVALSPAHPGDR